MWASGAALAIALAGLLSPRDLSRAVGNGTDVYLFLAGMMLLAEIARREGVFDWAASLAVGASGGSRARLFTLVYGVGIVVTAVLSNDATAVVLTPAVAASVRTAKAEPLPYLFACALIANAASFVLPISNPANLVVFARDMPALGPWLVAFTLPSIAAIAITYAVLRVLFRSELTGAVAPTRERTSLHFAGMVTLAGLGCTAVVLVAASRFGANLGTVTAIAGAVIFLIVIGIDRHAARPILTSVSWSVLPLVAGLFVLVAAAERTGLLATTQSALARLSALPTPLALLSLGFATAIASNVMNNLPAGLIAGATAGGVHADTAARSAVAIGIDLGPNLSVTGSLATILWLTALRREGLHVTAWRFLRVGLVAMPLALSAAVACLLVTTR